MALWFCSHCLRIVRGNSSGHSSTCRVGTLLLIASPTAPSRGLAEEDRLIADRVRERGGHPAAASPKDVPGHQELENIESSWPAPAGRRREVDEDEHVVQFYEREALLTESARDFVASGLRAGEAAIIVATKAHRDALDEALAVAGLDLAEARREGRYISLDAAETLSTLMVDGAPDPLRFRRVVGSIILAAIGGGRGVRVFGEMVALLCEEGNVAGAISLEELWNDLADSLPFSLFCAYPIGGFGSEEASDAFNRICAQHSSVIPGDLAR